MLAAVPLPSALAPATTSRGAAGAAVTGSQDAGDEAVRVVTPWRPGVGPDGLEVS